MPEGLLSEVQNHNYIRYEGTATGEHMLIDAKLGQPRPPASPRHCAAEAPMFDDDHGFSGDSPMPMVLS